MPDAADLADLPCSVCGVDASWLVFGLDAPSQSADEPRVEALCATHLPHRTERREHTVVAIRRNAAERSPEASASRPIARGNAAAAASHGRVRTAPSTTKAPAGVLLSDPLVPDVLAGFALRALPEPVLLTDARGAVLFANAAFLLLSGQDPAAADRFEWLQVFVPEDVNRVRALLERVLLPGSATFGMRVRMGSASVPRWVQLRGRVLRSSVGAALAFVLVLSECEVLLAPEELAELSSHDPLTGVYNRTHLLEHLDQLLRGRDRRPGIAVAMLLDLDHFHEVNDHFGYEAGDKILAALVQRLRSSVRPGDLLGRYGGDEFVAIFEGIEDDVQAIAIAQRLLERLRRPLHVGGVTSALDVSVGIAPTRGGGERAEAFLERADQAMYIAKGRAEKVVVAPSTG